MKEEKPKYTEAGIQSLDAREHIKLRPNLYFKEIYEEKSLDRFPLEVACHAIDKVMSKKCSFIKITLFSDYFSLEYDAGMSLKMSHDITRAEGIMTKMYTCRNYKEHLAVGDEFCKLGIMTINTASEWCTLLTYSDEKKENFCLKKEKPKRVLSAKITNMKIIQS
ncbi:hypothetical protein [Kordia sp.]|uniref:hypothetical protein n=1 Tax=Kordia sp. TaxID=1965332 RepID=UPI003B5B15C7